MADVNRESVKQETQGKHKKTAGRLAIVIVLMFGFGYALVPLYQVFCEITGLNFLTPADSKAAAFAQNTQVDTSRTIRIVLDGNVNGPWRFRPVQSSMEVHPGELVTVMYEVANQRPDPIVGQAIPSYAPLLAAQYFRKIECFCFTQQELGGHQTRQFPLVFVVDPALPKQVESITLSYTFFEVGGRSAQTAATQGAL